MSFKEILDSIYNFFSSPSLLNNIKAVLIFFIAILFLAIIITAIKAHKYITWELREKIRGTDIEPQKPSKLKRKWNALKKQLDSESDSAYKLAMIEADKILDDILNQAGYQGETTNERLVQMDESKLSNIEKVRRAHRLRNEIVHDLEVKVSKTEVKEAIENIEKALQELSAL